MEKTNSKAAKVKKIIYWIATIWLCLGMTSTGIVQLMSMKEEVAFIIALGYPDYLIPFLGITKMLGVIAVLIPRYPLLKEWAYAGFFIMMSGAIYSHMATKGSAVDIAPPLLLLVLTIAYWYYRPADRKTLSNN